MALKFISPAAQAIAAIVFATTTRAVEFGGIEFPAGAVSFADQVVSYDPAYSGGNVPTDPNYMDPTAALGVPDYTGTGSVSLGSGGRIVLRFVDNLLTGSDSADFDLHIFEIGPDVEDTFVDISMDGETWFSVGKVFGSTDSIDIDSFGFGSSHHFSYVRLTDDPREGATAGSTVGADIDAVGAISTVPNPVPDAAGSLGLLSVSCLLLAAIRRLRRHSS